jgi:hypothetical protein
VEFEQADQSFATGKSPDVQCVSFAIPLNGRFLTITRLTALLKDKNVTEHSEIPRGFKANVAFIVHNKENLNKRDKGKCSDFCDDCCVWISKGAATAKTCYEVMGDDCHVITLRQGQFMTICKRSWVVMEPQPDKDDILEMHRFYATLKSQPSYCKRVSWSDKSAAAERLSVKTDVEVVEYTGEAKLWQVHANTK